MGALDYAAVTATTAGQPAQQNPLAGRHIVVTRPAEQAARFASAIEAAGGVAVLFPVLTIHAIEDVRPLLDIAARLDEFDLAVFVSPNAVNHALAVIETRRAWPQGLRVATIGKGSERALAQHGIRDVIAPVGRFDSEALLALPELQDMTNRRVVIFRGNGGRELLGDTLMERGATLEYVTCYLRAAPAADAASLLRRWQHRELDAIAMTSSEGLRNLYELLDAEGRRWLEDTPLFVPHARIAEEAQRLGLHRVLPTGPGDEGLLAGMIDYFSRCLPVGNGQGH